MYYITIDNKLKQWGDYKFNDKCKELQNVTTEEYNENPNKYILDNGILIPNPNYEQEQAAKREADFKSKFFEIQNFGWYRKNPKGYSSAVESLNTAFNAVTFLGLLPANTLIFYTAPDFTKPEECTEEWLIAHQIFNQEMTTHEFGTFYVGFMTAWNNQEHNEGAE